MRKTIFKLFGLLLLGLMAGCQIDYQDEDTDVGPTSVGKCSVDGINLSFIASNATRPNGNSIALELYATTSGAKLPKVVLTLNKTTAGTYTASNASVTAAYYTASANELVADGATIEITILTISYLKDGVISGTFEFEGASQTDSETAIITSGTFGTTFKE